MLTALALSVTGIAVAPSASAATYSPVDGHSAYSALPSGTVCSQGARQQETAYLGNDGRVVLWYSPTCRSVWAQIYSDYTHTVGAGGNRWAGSATVHRNVDRLGRPDGKEYSCAIALGAMSCRTLMLWDADMTSYAKGVLSPGTGGSLQAQTSSY
jgi:Protein of unknown function (DUF2690)